MYSKVYSAAVCGMEGHLITVEADVSNGLPGFDMVGVLSTEVKEAASRVRTALRNSDFHLPPKRIVVNLAPADVRKDGNQYDLPVAVAVLSALGLIEASAAEGALFVGELGLDGKVRPVAGTMVFTETAKEAGLSWAFVPQGNAREGAVNGSEINVCGIKSLAEVVYLLQNPDQRIPVRSDLSQIICGNDKGPDFSEIRGQKTAKRAAEISAAGMHNLLLSGPPGTGKTMLARSIPGILPKLTMEECLEISRIYSIKGMMPEGKALITERPFRAPHHTVTVSALTGGGRIPKPGEFSLSVHGILFMDELPEMSRQTLEALRQPLEEGKVLVSRVNGSYEFPASFMMVAAMNPCPCGYYPDRNKCRCSAAQVERYQGRISQPIMDRIDLSVIMGRISSGDFFAEGEKEESSEVIRKRVELAQERQKVRFSGTDIYYNSRIPGGKIWEYCPLGKAETEFMKAYMERSHTSTRGIQRILKVARTIADLEGTENITLYHLKEAIVFRNHKAG